MRIILLLLAVSTSPARAIFFDGAELPKLVEALKETQPGHLAEIEKLSKEEPATKAVGSLVNWQTSLFQVELVQITSQQKQYIKAHKKAHLGLKGRMQFLKKFIKEIANEAIAPRVIARERWKLSYLNFLEEHGVQAFAGGPKKLGWDSLSHFEVVQKAVDKFGEDAFTLVDYLEDHGYPNLTWIKRNLGTGKSFLRTHMALQKHWDQINLCKLYISHLLRMSPVEDTFVEWLSRQDSRGIQAVYHQAYRQIMTPLPWVDKPSLVLVYYFDLLNRAGFKKLSTACRDLVQIRDYASLAYLLRLCHETHWSKGLPFSEVQKGVRSMVQKFWLGKV